MTRQEWIDARVDSFEKFLCPAMWHDEGHSSHSTCYSCGGTFMRGYEVGMARKRAENAADEAEKYARALGWIPPEERHEIWMQATRKERASDLKRYLVTDLEMIARRVAPSDAPVRMSA